MRFTVAIDGPAAAGKGTIAKGVARRFGFAHLDSGLLYRAVGLARADGTDPVEAAASLDVEALDESRLRGADLAREASLVAADPRVRAALVPVQRAFARREGGAVVDGRDIGTVICPEAEAKLFVTASDEVRARRRRDELARRGEEATLEGVLAALRARDERDSARAAAPLRQAPGAVLLDTSGMDVEAATEAAAACVEDALRGAGRDG